FFVTIGFLPDPHVLVTYVWPILLITVAVAAVLAQAAAAAVAPVVQAAVASVALQAEADWQHSVAPAVSAVAADAR
ncbi:hypothetical protein, partial [Pandoraea sputorum]|uniref:hypothetical protein n=1 Tax=Pandoraea sputorum TaxID=93222 RepID=UPI002F90ABFB